MTNLEISKALALAIGWREDRVIPDGIRGKGLKQCWVFTGTDWHSFDYRDWNVIGPIAEKYDAFPYQSIDGGWVSSAFGHHDTPQKAIALAVIQGAKT